MKRSHFAAVVSEQGDMQKAVSKDGVWRVVPIQGIFSLRFSENMKLLALLLTS